jgi:uncharacterized protein YcaQ
LPNVRSQDRVSTAEARRIALAAQGFAEPRPVRADVRHVRRALDRVGLVQIDSVNVLCRSHELPLWSRLGPHRRGALDDLAHGRRELFEYWGHAASFVPIPFHPAQRWRLDRARDEAWPHVRRMERERGAYEAAVLAESVRWLGIGTARDIADYFRINVPEARPRLAELVEAGALLPVEVEGWQHPAYLHPEARRPRRVDARALLSPFDSLVWERERSERIFGMRVVLEIYTPAPKRRWGYYVLPFLLGDALVGRVDLKADRAAGALVVQAAWIEPAHADRAPEVAAELEAELAGLATFLELDHVTTTGRGDLRLLPRH